MKRIATSLLCIGLTAATLSLRAQTEVVEITPPPAKTATDSSAVVETTPSTLPTDPPPAGWVKDGEVAIKDATTGEVVTSDIYAPPSKKLTDLYMEGGYLWMSMITVCLIAMCFAAWKAPRWIKEIGLLALVLGMFYFLLGIYEMSDLLHSSGMEIGKDISSNLLFGGLRVALIAPMYSLIVYGVSLVLRIAFKPRI